MTSTQRRGRHAAVGQETFVCGQAAVQVLWTAGRDTAIVDSSGPWHAIEPGPADVVFALCGRQVSRSDRAAVWPDAHRSPACVVCAELALD